MSVAPSAVPEGEAPPAGLAVAIAESVALALSEGIPVLCAHAVGTHNTHVHACTHTHTLV